MKLFKIELVNYYTYYVTATDPTTASGLLLKYLNKNEFFTSQKRKVKTIQVLAEVTACSSVFETEDY